MSVPKVFSNYKTNKALFIVKLLLKGLFAILWERTSNQHRDNYQSHLKIYFLLLKKSWGLNRGLTVSFIDKLQFY